MSASVSDSSSKDVEEQPPAGTAADISNTDVPSLTSPPSMDGDGRKKLAREDFAFHELLGEGSFGKVSRISMVF